LALFAIIRKTSNNYCIILQAMTIQYLQHFDFKSWSAA